MEYGIQRILSKVKKKKLKKYTNAPDVEMCSGQNVVSQTSLQKFIQKMFT